MTPLPLPLAEPITAVPLPADARAALRSFASDYLAWLPSELVLPVMCDMKDFVAEAADLTDDEALAVYLQHAPLFEAFMREAAYAAQFTVRFVSIGTEAG